MYIDLEGIRSAAGLVTALSTILGAGLALYRFYLRQKKQDEELAAIRAEQTMVCYGILACLKGLKEQGCNGPVTEALNKLEKHLNAAAHGQEEGRR
jgi:hypothetical protein